MIIGRVSCRDLLLRSLSSYYGTVVLLRMYKVHWDLHRIRTVAADTYILVLCVHRIEYVLSSHVGLPSTLPLNLRDDESKRQQTGPFYSLAPE